MVTSVRCAELIHSTSMAAEILKPSEPHCSRSLDGVRYPATGPAVVFLCTNDHSKGRNGLALGPLQAYDPRVQSFRTRKGGFMTGLERVTTVGPLAVVFVLGESPSDLKGSRLRLARYRMRSKTGRMP